MDHKDIFFLDIERALKETEKQNKIIEQGVTRLQYCYYDGVLTESVLENLIQVKQDNFVDFFANNQLPLPAIIIDQQGNSIDINQQMADMVFEIEQFRKSLTIENYKHKDSAFFTTLEALNTAKQKNRVACGKSLDGLQICYYHGNFIKTSLDNLIYVALDDLLHFFIFSCLRWPQKFYIERPQTQNYKDILECAQQNRNEQLEILKQQALQVIPDFQNIPINVLVIAGRFAYRETDDLIETLSDKIILDLEALGYNVLLYKEASEMEAWNEVDLLHQYIEHQPQIIVNFNQLVSDFCHPDVINITVWQELPAHIPTSDQLGFRINDFNGVASQLIQKHLYRCGAKNFFTIDNTPFLALFNSVNVERKKIEIYQNITITAENSNKHKQLLLKNLVILEQERPSLYHQTLKWLAEHKIHINLDAEIEGLIYKIEINVENKKVFFLDYELLLRNKKTILSNDRLAIYLLSEIGAGYELMWLYRNNDNLFQTDLDIEIPIYLVIKHIEQLLLVCLLNDISEIFTSKRVRLFYGEDALLDLHDDVINPYMPLIDKVINTSFADVDNSVKASDAVVSITKERKAAFEKNLVEVDLYYKSITQVQWAEKFKPENTHNLRVFSQTTRFSTYTQYCMRDLLDGFSRSGVQVFYCIEGENYHRSYLPRIVAEVNKFKPDLILCIDHFRHERPQIPINIPWVTWIQDRIPCVTENKEVMKLADFTYVFAKSWLNMNMLSEYQHYPIQFLPLGVNESLYKSMQDKVINCDILLVAHLVDPELTFAPIREPNLFNMQWIQTELDLIGQGRISKQDLTLLYGYIEQYTTNMNMQEYTHFCFANPIESMTKIVEGLSEYFQAKCTDDVFDLLISIVGNRFHFEALSRLKMWPINILLKDSPEVVIHVYGSNWGRYSQFKNIWQGKAQNGNHLNKLMNTAAICLNASPGTTMHMRAIEILASGAFMLTRRLTTDSSPIVDFFPEKNLAFFENEKDLVKQVDYYLEHVGERNKMAQRLRQQTIDNFSYLSIAEKIQSDIRLRFK